GARPERGDCLEDGPERAEVSGREISRPLPGVTAPGRLRLLTRAACNGTGEIRRAPTKRHCSGALAGAGPPLVRAAASVWAGRTPAGAHASGDARGDRAGSRGAVPVAGDQRAGRPAAAGGAGFAA